jgi:acyl-CoA synthetase (AMP-forming)/AMP-acid ligase II
MEFFVDLLAVWWLGGCAVPIDASLTPFEVDVIARAAGPRCAIVPSALEAGLAPCLASAGVDVVDATSAASGRQSMPPASAMRLDDSALILFTSGTTGDPKGVVHTHRSLRIRWTIARQCLGMEPYRRALCLLPTHFGMGLICNCLFPWLNGGDLHILPPFRPEILTRLGAVIDEYEITFLASVPALWRLALKMAKPPEGGTLLRVHCGSAPLFADLWRQIQQWTGTKEVFNTYGITETGSWIAGSNLDEVVPEDGLIGQPWGSEIRILKSATTEQSPLFLEVCAPGEEGFIWVSTPALMKGYFHRDDLTAEVVSDGWFSTGDIGVVDDRGLLYLRGRVREEINRGGLKVYPGDIDAVASQFPAVVDVCTFAVTDPLHGQNVGIALVIDDKGEERLAELRQWMTKRLARHQMPVRWHLLDEIPRTSRGKVNRAQVAQSCADLQAYPSSKP